MRHGSRRVPAALLAFGAASVLGQAAPAGRSAEASVHLDVPAGEWRSVRLQRIPVGADLAMDLVSDGSVVLWLVDAAGFARFPASEGVLFRGETRDRLSASVRAPTSGDYFVLVDNRAGLAPRSVDLRVRGATGAAAEAALALDVFVERLALLFEFESFALQVADCPDGAGGIACPEALDRLRAELGDPRVAREVLLFAIFHRTAHELLAQWEHAGAADEATADELGAALFAMLGRGQRLRPLVAELGANADALGRVAGSGRDDLHLPDAGRIARLRRHADAPDLARRWQPVLVPRMRTAALEQLRNAPEPWTDAARVRRELAARAAGD